MHGATLLLYCMLLMVQIKNNNIEEKEIVTTSMKRKATQGTASPYTNYLSS